MLYLYSASESSDSDERCSQNIFQMHENRYAFYETYILFDCETFSNRSAEDNNYNNGVTFEV